MILPIVKYGNPVLREKGEPIKSVTPEIKKLISDMLETMYRGRGVGLAGHQVGIARRLCVIDVPGDIEKETSREENSKVRMPLVMINPKITAREGSQRNEEGCLSFPNIGAQVTRANRVTATFTDREGKTQTVTASGLLARAIQHELDHLDGVLFIDKFSALQKMACSGQLKRLQKANSQ